jgi:negative regulator of flagellin synthesis FlgM
MKIADKNPYINLDAYTKSIKVARDQASQLKPASSVASEGDTVVLSPRAREIQELRRKLAEIPEVRENLVAELKEQVKSGIYQADSKKIAARMLG